MDGIKSSGSENLFGKDKLSRMLELAGVKNTVNESTNTIYTTGIQYKHAPNGKTYGIFREGQQYFIKEAKTTDNLCVESFNYIDGLRFKNENKYSSYSSALKRLNLMFNEFNHTEMLDEEIDMIRTDRLDEKKYIIKVPVTVSDEEVASPQGVEAIEDFGVEDDLGDFEEDEISLDSEEEIEGEEIEGEEEIEGDDEFAEFEDEESSEEEISTDEEGLGDEFEEEEVSFEDEETVEDGGEEESFDLEIEEDDPTKEIQKLTGKLSQKIRELGGEDPELEKYAINMIVSASHPEDMDMEDKQDIVDKLSKEPEEEEVVDIETDDIELEEMEEIVDAEEMDEEMEQMDEEEEIIYGEEEEETNPQPKIKISKEGNIEIFENKEEKSNIVIESDEEVDTEYEKIMFESMIKRTVKKVLSK